MFNDDFIDALSILSFVIGLQNLEENLDQSTLDNEMQKAVDVIENHLVEQDKKINLIMERLGIEYERN